MPTESQSHAHCARVLHVAVHIEYLHTEYNVYEPHPSTTLILSYLCFQKKLRFNPSSSPDEVGTAISQRSSVMNTRRKEASTVFPCSRLSASHIDSVARAMRKRVCTPKIKKIGKGATHSLDIPVVRMRIYTHTSISQNNHLGWTIIQLLSKHK